MADPSPDESEQIDAAVAGRDEAGEDYRGRSFWGWTFGAISLVAGLTWILMNISEHTGPADLVVGVVLAAGGLSLLLAHRTRLPRRLTWLVSGGTSLIGTVAGLALKDAALGGMFVYVERRGFPFKWLVRGEVAEDPGTARRLAEAAGWEIQFLQLAVDAVWWGLAGLVVMTIARRVQAWRR